MVRIDNSYPYIMNNQTQLSITYGPENAVSSSYDSNENDNDGYVGLINQAMTCYLNSLIQTIFMTPEFRNGIYRFVKNFF